MGFDSIGKTSDFPQPDNCPQADDTPLHLPRRMTVFSSVPITHKFKLPPALPFRPRWGTVRVKQRMTLLFQIGETLDPVRISVTNMLLLGRGFLHAHGLHFDLSSYGAYWHGVSRQHAVIVLEDHTLLKLIDLNSTNGTYLNGEQLLPHQPRILRDGDEVGLGHLRLTITFD